MKTLGAITLVCEAFGCAKPATHHVIHTSGLRSVACVSHAEAQRQIHGSSVMLIVGAEAPDQTPVYSGPGVFDFDFIRGRMRR